MVRYNTPAYSQRLQRTPSKSSRSPNYPIISLWLTQLRTCAHHTEGVPVIFQQEFRTTFVTPVLPLNAVVTVDFDKMSSQRLVGKLAFRSHGRVRLLASQGIDHRLGNRESSSVLCRTSRSSNTSVRNGDSRSCCLREPPEVDGVTAYGGTEVWFSLCAWRRKVCVGYLARPVSVVITRRLLHRIRALWSCSSASGRHVHEMSAHRGYFFLVATIFDRHPHSLLPPAHNHPPLQLERGVQQWRLCNGASSAAERTISLETGSTTRCPLRIAELIDLQPTWRTGFSRWSTPVDDQASRPVGAMLRVVKRFDHADPKLHHGQ
ncbi:hypothetical protein T01_13294 [Trichinella spiralis]|uniref:Uncharacterized protein n=1 Tax=Trichinella spiralis TaxID=6334 RepID=A0A0V1B9I2_TRISP|nr:hypothetical protein T01_13294 [Trichinella spiralis]